MLLISNPRRCLGALGALRDFSDRLIGFAYDCQIGADPDNVPYYLDCLQEVATGRKSAELIMKTSKISSDGVVGKKVRQLLLCSLSSNINITRQELMEAYRDITAQSELRNAQDLSDDEIVNRYKALVTDSGPERQKTLKQSLKKIGLSRNSQKISKIASDCKLVLGSLLSIKKDLHTTAIETYEEALAFIGVDKDTDDEMIVSACVGNVSNTIWMLGRT